MVPKLYYNNTCPPARSVLLTAKAIGLEFDLKLVNILGDEHLTPEYLKINPQHTLPSLDDNGYILWDSHAINAYLIGKYGKDDSLYPKDLQKRGIVDQRLHFNSAIIQPRMLAVLVPILKQGEKTISKDKIENVLIAYDFLETFLSGKNYLAGDDLTIADFCTITSITTLAAFIPIQDNHVNISKWLNRMEALPYYADVNKVGLDRLIETIRSKLA